MRNLIIAATIFSLLLLTAGLYFLYTSFTRVQNLQETPTLPPTTISITPQVARLFTNISPQVATQIPTQRPPTIAPQPISSISATLIELTPERKAIVNLMPVSGPDYEIEYFGETDIFVATLRTTSFEEGVARVQQWFRLRGVTDTSSYNVKFVQYKPKFN